MYVITIILGKFKLEKNAVLARMKNRCILVCLCEALGQIVLCLILNNMSFERYRTGVHGKRH